jgi:hypothetical protein
MRKLLFITVLAITIMACKKKPTLINQVTAEQVFLITLNGISYAQADTMIDHFQKYRGQDNRPIQRSVWFNKETLVKMVNLLNKEIIDQRKEDERRADTTDGIRVFFGSDISIGRGALSNTVLLVSTKNAGEDLTVPSKAFHKNYFEHDKDDTLFRNLYAIHGSISNREAVNARGEDLYDTCTTDCRIQPTRPGEQPHYITRGRAHAMVNAFGSDVITTNSEWFDINLFRAFAKDKRLDGIRIYFTRHPIDFEGEADKDYPLQAFVIVTTEKAGALHKDYFDPKTTEEYFKYYQKKNKLFGDPPPVGGQDNGELCPDNCKP